MADSYVRDSRYKTSLCGLSSNEIVEPIGQIGL
jgi:hypothetical protein